jgi:hypothetical protein
MSGSIHIIKRSIRVILHTESASSTDRGHALPEADKTAIRRASKRVTIVCAPRIILGFRPRSYSDSKNENPHYEYRYSDDCLLLAAVCRGRQNGVPNLCSSSARLPSRAPGHFCAGLPIAGGDWIDHHTQLRSNALLPNVT